MKRLMKNTVSALASCALALSASGSLAAFADVTPNPVISRGCPAYSGANPATASAANDEHYFSFWTGTAPDYLAYDLSGVPEKQREKVIAVWYNTSAYDKIGPYANQNMEPTDYTLEVNAAEGGKYPEEGWKVVETVTDNLHGSRQHVVDMKGYNWIRLNITKADGKTGSNAQVNFDIHNVSDGISDSWIFYGDSITAGGMNNCYGTGFATFVNRLDERFFPVQENGGIGGLRSEDGRNNIDSWLEICPAKYVSIAYGTNDAWGSNTPVETYYANTKYMVDAVLAKGKVPVLPTIPFSTNADVAKDLVKYNAQIEKLYEEYGDKIVKGPDFYEFFSKHTDHLADGVHPDGDGYEMMRELWAQTMYERVYSAETPQVTTVPEDTTEPAGEKMTLPGDTNLDGVVELADAVFIMQSLANPDNYKMEKQGRINADVDGSFDGMTSNDALTIQLYLLHRINELPDKLQ
ncbi:GDSL-type esterase/lipase family protein [Ruminococcus flavefaciens]|uniref:GDSL-type esterase/lipase family protein n=1 Tax=Ruminococcus flavefaciens TaxID=1265 RepID=UPI00048B5FB9|nr:GDSL-type esterase/lipase family protein [Ruminococcus flavefaciens]